VREHGAIVFGPVCIDGHDDGCRFRVVTHIHQDHIQGIEKSLKYCRGIAASSITLELLEELVGVLPRRKVVRLEYGDMHRFDECLVKALRARHIPGTIQVLVEYRGLLYAYSSDFKDPGRGTEIPKGVDVLVIDATYGDPQYRRLPEEIIIDEFVKLIYTLLSDKPVAIYAYYGKAQEAMKILRDYGVDAPFIVSSKQWRIAKRLEKFGLRISDMVLDGTREAEEIKRDGWYIAFEHFSRYRYRSKSMGKHHVLLTGWLFETAVRSIGSNRWIVGLSDHADFSELLYYVEESRPRILVVDAARGGFTAARFAKYVEQRLGIRALYQPSI